MLKVLRLLNLIGETNAPYNQLSLAARFRHDITLCTYFQAPADVPSELKVFSGDNTLRGFFACLRKALDADTYDVLHVHSSQLAFFWILFGLFARPKLPTVYTVHTSYSNLNLRNRLLTLATFAAFNKIIFCSHSSYNSFPSWIKRLVGKRASVIQNGVDLERVQIAIENQPKPVNKSPIIVTVGRLRESKKPLLLLKAFAQSERSDARLIYIGDGELRSELSAKMKSFGLADRVTMTGLIPREEVFCHLYAADLYVSASQVEGLPVSVMEALACGCPAILTDIPPHRELVEETNLIPLVAVGDVEGLAKQIQRFMAMSPDERRMIGEQCRRYVMERFSLDRMLSEYEKVFNQLKKVI